MGNLILSKPFTYVGTGFQLGHWPCNLTSRLLQATSPWLMSMPSMPRSTSILHRAKACNECRTSGVRDKGYCSQLFESPWTTLFKQPAVAGTLWASGLCLGILSNPPCRCKKHNRLIRSFVASKNGLQRIQHIQVGWDIPNDSFRVRLNNIISYILSDHIWSITALFSRAGTSFKLRYSEFICILGEVLQAPRELPGHEWQAPRKMIPWWCLRHLQRPRPQEFFAVTCCQNSTEKCRFSALMIFKSLSRTCWPYLPLSASTSRFNMPSMPEVTNSLFGEIWTKFQYMFSLSLFLCFCTLQPVWCKIPSL